ncbi:hypothetical protein DPMN_027363 [Dreissena polymorpha]|uniref:Uncharacterized protein n=1 Tax=Dreissena polymorpha TaxID=45954 RepID=A0A9D4RDD9_DREPO|nr:hypothetical protein DPMN_027363 [Dreissena polymorpha]
MADILEKDANNNNDYFYQVDFQLVTDDLYASNSMLKLTVSRQVTVMCLCNSYRSAFGHTRRVIHFNG